MGRRLGWLGLIAAAAALCAGTPVARASYVVYGCVLPNGAPAPLDGWTLGRGEPSGVAQNRCAAPRPDDRALYLGLARGPIPLSSAASANFQPPPATSIAAVTIYRHFLASGNKATYRSVFWYFENNKVIGGCSVYLIGCAEQGTGTAGQRFAPQNRVDVPAQSAHRIQISASCADFAEPLNTTCWDGPGGQAWIYGSRIALRDLSAPRFTLAPTGPLLDRTTPVDGARSATFGFKDSGGGVSRAILIADDEAVHQESLNPPGGSCRAPYVRVVPCPTVARVTMDYDTRSLSNGVHRLRVGLEDAGGNVTLSAPYEVTIENGGRPNGVGATRFAELSGRFAGSSSARPLRRVVRYGHGAQLKGRLVDAGGDPIRSATLGVAVRTRRPGAGWRSVGSIVTRDDGRFAASLPAGSSRDVRVVYRAFEFDPAPAAELSGSLVVHASVALAVAPRRVGPGGRIVFRGRLVGGPGRAGTQVTLYAVAGRVRIPVAVLRANRRGRFRYAYRFRRTFAPTTFRFQARVEAQRGYPYAAGQSRRVAVTVR